MMKSLKKWRGTWTACAIGIAAFSLNYWAATNGHSPFIYCWGRPLVAPLYDAVANVANLAAMLYLFVQASRFRVADTIYAMGVVLLVVGTPTYADIVFRVGGHCG